MVGLLHHTSSASPSCLAFFPVKQPLTCQGIIHQFAHSFSVIYDNVLCVEYTEIIKSRADVACVNSNGGVFFFSSRRFDTILPEWSQAANGLKFPVTKPARLPTPDELPMTRLRNTRLLRFVLMSRLVAVVVISLHPFKTP